MNALREILKELHAAIDELSGLYPQLNDFKMYKEITDAGVRQITTRYTVGNKYGAQEILVALLALSEQSKSSVESPAFPLEGGISTEPSHVSLTAIQFSNNLDLPS